MNREAPRRLSPNLEGALWMLAATFTFVAMTTMVKYLGSDYPPQLQSLYRQAVAVLALLPFIALNPRGVLPIRQIRGLVFRAACFTFGAILLFYSYQSLPMATANALSFTRPLWVTLLAGLFLRERLGLHKIAAVLLGFAGVLIIARPAAGVPIGLPLAAALGAALLSALSVLGSKTLTRQLTPLSVLAWSSILGLVISAPLGLAVWRWPSAGDLALLALMGGLGVLNQFLFIRGMSVGDAAVMAPLDYNRLVLSVAAGYFLFAELPSWRTLLGAVIIVGSTLYATMLELAKVRRAARSGAGEHGDAG